MALLFVIVAGAVVVVDAVVVDADADAVVPLLPRPWLCWLCWLYVLQLCKALETFTHLYGHTQVPINFEVPRDEPWPISTWNVKLGMSLSNIVTKVYTVGGWISCAVVRCGWGGGESW